MDLRPNIPPPGQAARFLTSIGRMAVLMAFAARVSAAAPASEAAQTNAVGSKPPEFASGQTNIVEVGASVAGSVANVGGSNGAATPVTAAGNGTNGMKDLDDKYKLVMGDRLSFRIVEDDGEPKALVVTDSGDLEVPYLGRVPAVGKSCKQLAAEIKTTLDKTYYYDSTVIIAVDLKNKPRKYVYITGYVRLPGPVEIVNDEVLTLSQAIIRSGGTTDFANLDDMQVTRKSEDSKDGMTNFSVNFREILKGKKDKDMPLKPDDLINVKEEKVHL